MKPLARPFVLIVVLAVAQLGCATTAPPLRVRANDLHALDGVEGVIAERPVIVELFPGDTIPLYVTIEGEFAAGPTGAPPVPIVVKRHFFLRIAKDGLRTSADGSFSDSPTTKGQFRFGVGVTKKDGLRAEIAIRTPEHRAP